MRKVLVPLSQVVFFQKHFISWGINPISIPTTEILCCFIGWAAICFFLYSQLSIWLFGKGTPHKQQNWYFHFYYIPPIQKQIFHLMGERWKKAFKAMYQNDHFIRSLLNFKPIISNLPLKYFCLITIKALIYNDTSPSILLTLQKIEKISFL